MSKSVLLADDTAMVRTLLRQGLERDGRFRVVAEAGTGPEAVELSASLRPDAVVMDLSMPSVDGAGAIRDIHRESPDSKIIVLADGHDGGAIVVDAPDADAYLDKATAPSAISSTLISLCGTG
jgi:two-component system chemotaxis response regulator CheY